MFAIGFSKVAGVSPELKAKLISNLKASASGRAGSKYTEKTMSFVDKLKGNTGGVRKKDVASTLASMPNKGAARIERKLNGGTPLAANIAPKGKVKEQAPKIKAKPQPQPQPQQRAAPSAKPASAQAANAASAAPTTAPAATQQEHSWVNKAKETVKKYPIHSAAIGAGIAGLTLGRASKSDDRQPVIYQQ